MRDAAAYLTLEFGAGTDIEDAGKKALEIGKMLGVHVKFKFNGVDCTIYSNRVGLGDFVKHYHSSFEVEGMRWISNRTSEGI